MANCALGEESQIGKNGSEDEFLSSQSTTCSPARRTTTSHCFLEERSDQKNILTKTALQIENVDADVVDYFASIIDAPTSDVIGTTNRKRPLTDCDDDSGSESHANGSPTVSKRICLNSFDKDVVHTTPSQSLVPTQSELVSDNVINSAVAQGSDNSHQELSDQEVQHLRQVVDLVSSMQEAMTEILGVMESFKTVVENVL